MEVTLFELHLDDSPVTAHAPFSGRSKGSDDSSKSDDGTSVTVESGDDESESGSKVGAVLAVLLVVGLAVAARRFKNRGSSDGGGGIETKSPEVETSRPE